MKLIQQPTMPAPTRLIAPITRMSTNAVSKFELNLRMSFFLTTVDSRYSRLTTILIKKQADLADLLSYPHHIMLVDVNKIDKVFNTLIANPQVKTKFADEIAKLK